MSVPEIYSGPSHCVVYGVQSSYQSAVARMMLTHAAAGGGSIIFVGRSSFDGEHERERFQTQNGWSAWATKTRPHLDAVDLIDYQRASAVLLEDLKQLFLPSRRPWIVYHDRSAELRDNDFGWWDHASHIRRNLLAARVVTCVSGDPPPHAICDQRIKVVADGYALTVSERDEVTRFMAKPVRGVIQLREITEPVT